MIRVEELWRSYQMGEQVVHALHGVSETIENGEHVAIMGPSGSGKSTFLNLIGCLDSPTRGRYFLAGEDVAGLPEDARAEIRLRRIGFIFQSFHLVPRLTALENVALPLVFAGKGPAQRRAQALEALDSVGLSDRAGHKPSELSGGEKQRIAIARAIVTKPKLVILDEPVSALDVSIQAQILNLLKDMQAMMGLTYLFISHDLSVVRQISTRVAVMYLGAICELGRCDDVFSAPRHHYTRALFSAVPDISSRSRQSTKAIGELPSATDLPSGCTFHPRCPAAQEKCRVEVPKLIEISEDQFCACHFPA